MSSDSDSDDEKSLISSKSFGSRAIHACPHGDCGKFFSRPSRLKTHLLSHSGEKPFKCFIVGCEKSYARRAHLKRHEQNEHEKKLLTITPRLSCELCEKTFANIYSLKKHAKKAHESQDKIKEEPGSEKIKEEPVSETDSQQEKKRKRLKRLHGCEKCNETFLKWSEYQKHLKVAHPKEKKLHQCNICRKEFASSTTYKSHLPIHSDLRSVFRCVFPMCPRWYYFERNLTEHIKGYHEGLRFPCPVDGCHARLGSRAAKTRHIKKCHESFKRPDSNAKFAPKAARKDKGSKKLPSAIELSGLQCDSKLSKAVQGACGQVSLSPDAVAEEIRSSEEILKMLGTVQDTSITDNETVEVICPPDDSTLFVLPRALAAVDVDSNDEDELENCDKETIAVERPCKKYDFSAFLSG